MTTVGETVTLPAGVRARQVQVKVFLAGEDGKPYPRGYATTLDDTAIVGEGTFPLKGNGTWSADLTPTDDITPAGTRWGIVLTGPPHISRAPVFINVPASGGPYTVLQLVSDPPGAIPSPAVEIVAAALADLEASLPSTYATKARTSGKITLREFGAVGDGREWRYGTIEAGSAVLTLPVPDEDDEHSFEGLEGKWIAVSGAGPGGGRLVSTIESVQDVNVCTLADEASTTVAPLPFTADTDGVFTCAGHDFVDGERVIVVVDNPLTDVAGVLRLDLNPDEYARVRYVKYPAAGEFRLAAWTDVNEVYSIDVGVGVDSYTLSFDGETTAPIAGDADFAAIDAALTALSTIGPSDVVVSGRDDGLKYVEFVNALGAQEVPPLTATPTGGVVDVVLAQAHTLDITTAGSGTVQRLTAGIATYGTLSTEAVIEAFETAAGITSGQGGRPVAVDVSCDAEHGGCYIVDEEIGFGEIGGGAAGSLSGISVVSATQGRQGSGPRFLYGGEVGGRVFAENVTGFRWDGPAVDGNGLAGVGWRADPRRGLNLGWLNVVRCLDQGTVLGDGGANFNDFTSEQLLISGMPGSVNLTIDANGTELMKFNQITSNVAQVLGEPNGGLLRHIDAQSVTVDYEGLIMDDGATWDAGIRQAGGAFGWYGGASEIPQVLNLESLNGKISCVIERVQMRSVNPRPGQHAGRLGGAAHYELTGCRVQARDSATVPPDFWVSGGAKSVQTDRNLFEVAPGGTVLPTEFVGPGKHIPTSLEQIVEEIDLIEWHRTWSLSDVITPITVGIGKEYDRAPFLITPTDVRLELATASSNGKVEVDILDAGSSIFSTRPTIDQGAKTSVGAAIPHVFSDLSLADDHELRFDIILAGVGAIGLKVTLYGTYVRS